MARMKAGLDVWVCICSTANIMGRKCSNCGRGYGDVLEMQLKAEQPDKPKKRKSKFRTPAKEGTFIQSFFFPKPKN